MAPSADQLAAVEARLRALLVPYEDRLEWATIYGIPTLRRAGANAHQWFAFVKPASAHVSLYLLPVVEHPSLLDPISPELAARHTGKSTFTFKVVDERLLAELEALLARAFAVYVGEVGSAGPPTQQI